MTQNDTDGQLFVLEGCDNVGKSTVAKALSKTLRKLNHKVKVLSFPGKKAGSIGKWVYDFHHEPTKKTINNTSLQLLHIAAHIDCVESQIKPLLSRGYTIILNRFWWSTWAYGVVSGVEKKHLRKMIDLEVDFWAEHRPDCVFFLRRSDVEKTTESLLLIKEYKKLANREQKKYPVAQVVNEGDVADTLEVILERIPAAKCTTFKPLQKLLSYNNNRIPQNRSPLSPLEPSRVYDTYWHFAVARQEVFFRRLSKTVPITTDPILLEYKFTNAYRAADRVSQYLIKNVIYVGDQSSNEVFFRIMLFKIFNRISTWELFIDKLGSVCFENYSFSCYDKILTKAIDAGQRIYSAAYIMPSGGRNSEFGRKHRMHLKLIESMLNDELPDKIAQCNSMSEAFTLLRSYPTLGDFLAYQYVTDLNYSNLTDFSEMEFVVAGPGARNGIRKCFQDFGGLNDAEIIHIVTERQEEEFDARGLEFKDLFGRKLQLIDCQNLFCEVDKYSRVKHPEFSGTDKRTRIKQKFHLNPEPIEYWFPPKWGINQIVEQEVADATGV